MTSLHSLSVPVFKQMLGGLQTVLAKAEAHATARKIDPDALLQARLFPDMFPLLRQVQVASDFAKSVAARLANVEVPKLDDNEKTFAELYARIEKTIAYIGSFKEEQLDGSEDKTIELKLRNFTPTFSGSSYLFTFALPNFFFHVTTAYDILRNSEVPIGKLDYLGRY